MKLENYTNFLVIYRIILNIQRQPKFINNLNYYEKYDLTVIGNYLK